MALLLSPPKHSPCMLSVRLPMENSTTHLQPLSSASSCFVSSATLLLSASKSSSRGKCSGALSPAALPSVAAASNTCRLLFQERPASSCCLIAAAVAAAPSAACGRVARCWRCRHGACIATGALARSCAAGLDLASMPLGCNKPVAAMVVLQALVRSSWLNAWLWPGPLCVPACMSDIRSVYCLQWAIIWWHSGIRCRGAPAG